MKYQRTERYERIELTSRRLKAIETKPERDRQRLADKMPLFADQLPAAEPVDVQDVMAKRQAHSEAFERDMRAMEARFWRRARHDYFATPAHIRAEIIAAWNAWRGPLTSLNFRYIVDKFTGVHDARIATHKQERAESAARILAMSEPTGSLFDQ